MHRDYSTVTQRVETERAETEGLLARRQFLAGLSIGAGYTALGKRAIAASEEPLKVKDVVEHFLSRSPWVNRDNTVDRVIIGDAEKKVDKCIVTWMPSFKALRKMVEQGIDFMICHEPTFWNHRDKRPTDPTGLEKIRFIEKHDIVVVRNHDCWDRWPKIGIPSAWGQFLGLGPKPAKIHDGAYHRYDIEPTGLDEFAKRVARRCAKIGEPMVQVTGDGQRPVSRIGIGTGCICDIPTYRKMGCDCSIVVDDGGNYWSSIQHAADGGHPVIRVHHGVAEEPGMVTLTNYINTNIGGLRAILLPHGSTFRLVGA